MRIRIRELGAYPSRGAARRLRVRTPAGRETTVHVAEHPAATTTLQLVHVEPAQPAGVNGSALGCGEALNGGFFTKPQLQPLGEVVIDGAPRRHTAFTTPYHRTRGAIWTSAGTTVIAPRNELPAEPAGDLLQAGPLLVRDGQPVVAPIDPEGFAATCDEFDSDITVGPLPRTAIALTAAGYLAMCVDGRAPLEDGLTLVELAALLAELGAVSALNLDGGTSSALITDGVLRNRPRNDAGVLFAEGYPNPTAFLFRER